MERSNLYPQLKWRYRFKRFTAVTEAGKEAVKAGATFIFWTGTIGYFTAHWLWWFVNGPALQ